ncbi:MAG: tetratricopeptide repeat protein [Bacteroidota bacterium]|jgi:tetratricopeptide (TPR) repeat protein
MSVFLRSLKILLLILINHQGFSQGFNSDSSFKLYLNSKTDPQKLKHLLNYLQNFRPLQADTLYLYAEKGLQLSNQQNSDSGRAISNLGIGMSFQKRSDFKQAIQYYTKAQPFFEKVKMYDGLASVIYFRGVMHVFLGDYKSTLNDFFKALDVCEKHQIKARSADILIGLANVYARLNNNKKCIEYNLKAIQLIESQPNVQYYSLVASYINLGGVYAQERDYDKAVKLLSKAIKLANEKSYADWQIKANGNIAGVYVETGNTKEALKHLLLVVRLAESNNDQVSLSEAYVNLGNLYAKNKDKSNSERYFLRALKITETLNDVNALKEIYFSLYKSYYQFNDYKSSVFYLEKHLALKDSLLNNENIAQLNSLEAKYDSEKKEQMNQILQKDNLLHQASLKFQRSVIILVIAGLFVTLILLFFIIRGFKKQQKANQIILFQKVEVEQQKQKIEEHQREIVDSINYAKKIQEAMLPAETYLKKHLKNNNT